MRKVILLVLFATVACQLQHQLHHQINNMITGAVGVGHLVGFAYIDHQYHAANIHISQLDNHLTWPTTLKQVGWGVRPFERLRGLKWGANSKYSALSFFNHINSGAGGAIVSNAILGIRSGDSVQLISAFGMTGVYPIQQYTVQREMRCNYYVFFRSCWDEDIRYPRGFYQHELDAVITESERLAAISMRQSLGLGTLPEPSLGTTPFIAEHSQLRALYPEIEYRYEDSESVDLAGWNGIFAEAFDGHGDQAIRDRMHNIVVSSSHANFIYAPTHRDLYYIIVRKSGESMNVHKSHFLVREPGRLPAGAFGTSVGGWNLERGGEGATPSIHQILSIFGFK